MTSSSSAWKQPNPSGNPPPPPPPGKLSKGTMGDRCHGLAPRSFSRALSKPTTFTWFLLVSSLSRRTGRRCEGHRAFPLRAVNGGIPNCELNLGFLRRLIMKGSFSCTCETTSQPTLSANLAPSKCPRQQAVFLIPRDNLGLWTTK